jgi:hypothetical protein
LVSDLGYDIGDKTKKKQMGLHGIKKSAEQRKQHWVLNDALL